MKQILIKLAVLFVTATCLTSDTTLSSKPEDSTEVNSSADWRISVGTTPRPKYWDWGSWESIGFIPVRP